MQMKLLRRCETELSALLDALAKSKQKELDGLPPDEIQKRLDAMGA